jgi:hypothetical protein
MITTRFLAAAAVAGSALLSGCAALNTVGSDVTSFGEWPTERAPGTYSFDRLPSQQKNPQRQDQVEAAASQALQSAGFRPAEQGAKGEYTIQVGARIDRYEASPWADPFWWPGLYHGYYPGWWAPYGPGPYFGPYYGRPWCCPGGFGPYWGPGYWGPYYYGDYYDRQVAVLIRNAGDGKPLYESHASNSGTTSGGERLIAAMFEAAMKDFPHPNDQMHTVSIEMQPKQPKQ